MPKHDSHPGTGHAPAKPAEPKAAAYNSFAAEPEPPENAVPSPPPATPKARNDPGTEGGTAG